MNTNAKAPAHLFLCVQPWRGWRHVNVTQPRTNQAFAQQRQVLGDGYLPTAERIRLVVNKLNTHTPAALYETLAPLEARRVTRTLEFHSTPKHGSWLTMAECELAVLAGQCLDRHLANLATLREQSAVWQYQRNQHQTKIHWQFGTDLARVKRKRLYPALAPTEDPAGPEEVSEPIKTSASAH